VGALKAARAARTARPTRLADRIDRAFESFTADYLGAQQVYLQASAVPGADTALAVNTFERFTNQRGNLLAQQLIPILGHMPGALAKLRDSQRESFDGASTTLQAFLMRRITSGPSALVTVLNRNVPPAGATGATADLYTLTARNAIEAARVNTYNAIGLLNTGRFTPKKHG
jgi:hypothetical protein